MMRTMTENYTFKTESGDLKTVRDIPSAEIDALRKNLNLSTRKEALELWCFDHGHISNEEADALTAKAKGVRVNTGAKAKRKAPTRKPDEVKRELIKQLEAFVSSLGNTDDVVVTNVERIVAFSIGDDNYELTLSKKRKAK